MVFVQQIFLKRTEMNYDLVAQLAPSEIELTIEEKEQIEIQVKYEGYIEKSLQQVEKLKKMEDKKIPDKIDYDAISGLATEARQKLKVSKTIINCTSNTNFRSKSCRYFYFTNLY